MNLVKGTLYFLLIMLVAGLLAALFAPSTKEVRRSISIEVPVEAVYNQVAAFENWKKWDAWYQKDPSHKRTYSGSAGDKSYGYKWASDNEDIGKGSMTMDAVKNNERLEYTVSIGQRTNTGFFTFASYSGTTEVEWVMISQLTYPMTILNYFIDGMIGSDFETGLINLKEYTENTPLVELLPKNKSVAIVEEHGVNYAYIKGDKIPLAGLSSFLEKAYENIFTHIQTNGLVPKGPLCGLYYKGNENEGTITLAAAVPISETHRENETKIQLSEGCLYLGSDYIVSTAQGGNSRIYNTHILLSDWAEINAKQLKMPMVEEYDLGPNDTSDTSQYETKITYYFE
jgi:effector-binding domain-containing protein